MTDPVLINHDKSSNVTTITLNRPEAMNSLTNAAKVLLRDALAEAATDPAVRAVVLTGTGRGFCVGQDLVEHLDSLEKGPVSDTVQEHFNPMVRSIMNMPKPVIAAINGTAAGAGLSLALAADFRIAVDSAKFTTAFANIALSCDTGVSWTLPRIVGRANALDLLLTSRVIDSAEALRIGMVNQVVPQDQFVDTVSSFAAQLGSGPTFAIGSIKSAVNFGETTDLDGALDFEAAKMGPTGKTNDHDAAVKAFLAKEKPTFTGS